MAPFCPLPTIKSISQSPNLFPSASSGRSWMLMRSVCCAPWLCGGALHDACISSCDGSGIPVLRSHPPGCGGKSFHGRRSCLCATATRISVWVTNPRLPEAVRLPASHRDGRHGCREDVHDAHQITSARVAIDTRRASCCCASPRD